MEQNDSVELENAHRTACVLRDKLIDLSLRRKEISTRLQDTRASADQALCDGKQDEAALAALTRKVVLLDEQHASLERALAACRLEFRDACKMLYAVRLAQADTEIREVDEAAKCVLRGFVPHIRGIATCAIRAGWAIPDPQRDPFRFLQMLADELKRHAAALTHRELSGDIENILGPSVNFGSLVGVDRQTVREREIVVHNQKAQLEKAGVAAVEAELLGTLAE